MKLSVVTQEIDLDLNEDETNQEEEEPELLAFLKRKRPHDAFPIIPDDISAPSQDLEAPRLKNLEVANDDNLELEDMATNPERG